jgi:N-glycosylase/DNA lyase
MTTGPARSRDTTLRLQLPGGHERTFRWGQPWEYMTAAYWVEVTKELRSSLTWGERAHRMGETMREEVVACLLGGHGITFEMNVAAFSALRDAGHTSGDRVSEEKIIALLRAPLLVGRRTARYRFPNQKGARVAEALHRLKRESAPSDALEARAWLMTFKGIGPKTASWIVRNQYDANDVAIIDIHVQRAGVHAGVFDPSWEPTRHYPVMESTFLQWADFGGVPASDLDAVIWTEQAAAARRRGMRAS